MVSWALNLLWSSLLVQIQHGPIRTTLNSAGIPEVLVYKVMQDDLCWELASITAATMVEICQEGARSITWDRGLQRESPYGHPCSYNHPGHHRSMSHSGVNM